MSAPICSECGNRDATFMVEVDGDDVPMCDPCTAWWVQHGLPRGLIGDNDEAPKTRPVSGDSGDRTT